jgi:hypothetical protein
MNTHHITTIAALMAALVIGCSKQPTTQTKPAAPDVGVVDFTDHTPKYFGIGGDRSCTITGATNSIDGPQMITIDVVFQQTNADKTVQILGTPKISVSAGHPCIVSSGDVSVRFMPKF